MADGRALPGSFLYADDSSTRLLCAAAHLEEDFALETAVELTEDRLEALGPSLGLGLVAVARHARAAVRRTTVRDALLSGLLVVLAGCVYLGGYGIQVQRGELLGRSLAGIAGTFAAAWAVVLVTERRARARALELITDRTPPEALAPPLEPAVEARLHEQEQTNVVPYHESAERDSPFVGSGVEVQSRVWQPIDVSTPAKSSSGGDPLTAVPFDVIDLHAFVAEEMGGIAGLEGLRAHERLYVLGTRVQYAGQELLPDQLRRPRAVVPPERVRTGLARPGAGMRTYLCLERAGEGGRVVATLFLRARLQHPSLTWEVAAYVVPPLRTDFERVRTLSVDVLGRWWTLFTFTGRGFLPALFRSPARLLGKGAGRAARGLRLWWQRWTIDKRHIEFDYGATDSIRAKAGDWQRVGFSERTDAVDFLQRLQQGVLTATERFLKAHNIDTTSFDQAQQVINHHSYTFQGPIHGPGNYGAGGSVVMGGPGPSGAPGGPGPSPAPAKP
ncbi:hypothetical protein [Streptomyces lavendulae]|uniref:hypothetical protein n=1 Tax=Streptomyces lavendulae TaxID=1914 RepID=UPI0024A50240|nr:hypothetical protein [Streptomyces lavendulae]GLX21216.1 hypothetical protein Slala01_48600 [Streptomyces lavendulae subsp. lavendulae]GLX27735.1 hypothetical protein Slala02_35550 [Streptomyces lavendulae subsp. lavendulae]